MASPEHCGATVHTGPVHSHEFVHAWTSLKFWQEALHVVV
jgi:hypothetical protein